MDFGEVLSRAWRIIWKHKILWVFGIFTGLAAQLGGSSPQGVQYRFDIGDFNNGRVPPALRDFGYSVEHYINAMPVWFWVVLFFSLFILGILFWVVSIYGRAGLIHGASDADEDAPLTFGGLFQKGSHFFGRLFLYDLLLFVGAIVVPVGIILILGVFAVFTLGIGLLCLVPLICLLIPISWMLGIYFIQVQVALVVEDLDVFTAFRRAWRVVTGRLGEMVVMGLILFVIGLAAGILMAMPFGLVVTPFIASLMASSEITTTAITASVVIGLVLLPFAILGNGIVQAYALSSWTLTFRRLTGYKAGIPAVIEPAAPVQPAAPVPPEAPETLPPQA